MGFAIRRPQIPEAPSGGHRAPTPRPHSGHAPKRRNSTRTREESEQAEHFSRGPWVLAPCAQNRIVGSHLGLLGNVVGAQTKPGSMTTAVLPKNA